MADGPLPDASAAAFALQQDIKNRMQGAGGGAVFGILQDVQFQNFKLPAGIGSADAKINRLPQQGKPGLIAKLIQEMALTRSDILEGIKKVNQAGPVQSASIADITGSSHGLGGFGGGGGGIEMG